MLTNILMNTKENLKIFCWPYSNGVTVAGATKYFPYLYMHESEMHILKNKYHQVIFTSKYLGLFLQLQQLCFHFYLQI